MSLSHNIFWKGNESETRLANINQGDEKKFGHGNLYCWIPTYTYSILTWTHNNNNQAWWWLRLILARFATELYCFSIRVNHKQLYTLLFLYIIKSLQALSIYIDHISPRFVTQSSAKLCPNGFFVIILLF